MDEIDERIVEIMTADARTSFRKIAKELERSPDTIINRFQRLKDSGDIRGSTVVVEPRKIGYEGMAAFHIDVSTSGECKTDSTSILKTLIRMPNIIIAKDRWRPRLPRNRRHPRLRPPHEAQQGDSRYPRYQKHTNRSMGRWRRDMP